MKDFSGRMPQQVSWESLLESINSGASHPEQTTWMIFGYLQANYQTIGSVMARTLLSAYIKLHVRRQSAADSCMLGMAAKISETYADFQFPKFLLAWGYPDCLRTHDMQRATGNDGRQYLSLKERVERALQAYMLHHPDQRRAECRDIVSMYAVNMIEKETHGRRHRYAKLVAPDGQSLIADSHQFACRPWEVAGRMYDVLTRTSKQGTCRAADIVPSRRRVDEVFSLHAGFVGHIDAAHGHIHVFDSQSRHFVAGQHNVAPGVKVSAGCYVLFCPIIVNGDRFKSAAIVSALDVQRGREQFGAYDARIEYVDAANQYMRYTLLSPVRPTPEGEISPTGFASTRDLPAAVRETLAAGAAVRLVLFLKRGKDGAKHNHVAEVF